MLKDRRRTAVASRVRAPISSALAMVLGAAKGKPTAVVKTSTAVVKTPTAVVKTAKPEPTCEQWQTKLNAKQDIIKKLRNDKMLVDRKLTRRDNKITALQRALAEATKGKPPPQEQSGISKTIEFHPEWNIDPFDDVFDGDALDDDDGGVQELRRASGALEDARATAVERFIEDAINDDDDHSSHSSDDDELPSWAMCWAPKKVDPNKQRVLPNGDDEGPKKALKVDPNKQRMIFVVTEPFKIPEHSRIATDGGGIVRQVTRSDTGFTDSYFSAVV